MGTLKKIAGPAYIAASATNIYTPPNAAVDTVIKHIRVSNKDTAAAYHYTLYVGAHIALQEPAPFRLGQFDRG